MFSGIVEEAAQVVALEREQENLHITLACSFAGELKIDQSVAHNGVCLTVVRKGGSTYTVTAIQETLDRSNLGDLHVGDKVNVERSMMMNGRLDGHIVQGHVDQTATCTDVAEDGCHTQRQKAEQHTGRNFAQHVVYGVAAERSALSMTDATFITS